MTPEAGGRLLPGDRLAGGGVFICKADDEGAWVAWPNADTNRNKPPSLKLVRWGEIEVYVALPYLQCNRCEWRSDDGSTMDIRGHVVPANPDAEHGDPCPLCGSDEQYPGRLARACTWCEGSGFDGRCTRCGGDGWELIR